MFRARWRSTRGIVVLLLCLALLAAGAWVGAGIYYSNQLLAVSHRPGPYGVRVLAADAAGHTVTLARSTDTERPGVYGLSWAGGSAVLGAVTGRTADGVTRRVTGAVPRAGTAARLETSVWSSDPQQARGLRYVEVKYRSTVGAMPAWYVPGAGRTWVVAVHGRGNGPRETLRILPTLHALGMPVLAISYRNDEDAPPERDGLYHLGDREWRDVEGAVRYAVAAGARSVVLYGWSMGGALITAFLQRSTLAGRVPALVLDAPVLDWRATLARQGANRHLPLALTATAEQIASWRIGIRWGEFDLDDTPGRLQVPTLLFSGTADTTVPIGPARRLAAANPEVTLVAVPGAGHTQSWNVAPSAYEQRVSAFLRPYAR